jgi:phosphohistidine phosphatase
MHILIVRHGLAGKADPDTYPDDDLRPLTDKGRKTFKKAAKGLWAQAPKPVKIFASPAVRTLQTAELLAKGMRADAESILAMPELHHGVSPAKALDKLSRMRLPAAFALVGHEPWLGEFLALLIGDNAGGKRGAGSAGKAGPPGGGARVEFDKGGACLVEAETPGRGTGALKWLMTREQLAGLA